VFMHVGTVACVHVISVRVVLPQGQWRVPESSQVPHGPAWHPLAQVWWPHESGVLQARAQRKAGDAHSRSCVSRPHTHFCWLSCAQGPHSPACVGSSECLSVCECVRKCALVGRQPRPTTFVAELCTGVHAAVEPLVADCSARKLPVATPALPRHLAAEARRRNGDWAGWAGSCGNPRGVSCMWEKHEEKEQHAPGWQRRLQLCVQGAASGLPQRSPQECGVIHGSNSGSGSTW
jgi:hypothetical protein